MRTISMYDHMYSKYSNSNSPTSLSFSNAYAIVPFSQLETSQTSILDEKHVVGDSYHQFHYSDSSWDHAIPDSLVVGNRLWTRSDEDRLQFLNDAIKDMRQQESRDIAIYNRKLEALKRPRGAKRGNTLKEIAQKQKTIQTLSITLRKLRRMRMENAQRRDISSSEKRANDQRMKARIAIIESNIQRLRSEITRMRLAKAKRSNRTAVVKELKELEGRIRNRSRDITQAEEERSLLLKAKRLATKRGGDDGGGGGGGGREGVRKQRKKKREAVALFK